MSITRSSAPPRASRSRPPFVGLSLRLALTDLLCVVVAVLSAALVEFGQAIPAPVPDGDPASHLGYTLIGALVAAFWVASLHLHASYEWRIFGHGPTEYRRVATATVGMFALVAMSSYALKLELARGYVLVALPLGLCGLLVNHRLWRRWLVGQRRRNLMQVRVLVVGEAHRLAELVKTLDREVGAGYAVVGACCSDRTTTIGNVPVLGPEEQAARIAVARGVQVVACSSSWHLGSDGLKRLGWDLEGSGADLVVVPGLTDIAGPRIHARPVAGLPLLHVEEPTFHGPERALKATMDVIGAAVALVVLSPLMLVIGVLIRLGDGGPILFRQRRVGLDGTHFEMFKFRSMVADAEAGLAQARAAGGDGVDRGPMFKAAGDPRVTHIGRWIRKYSLDELPQLLNVLRRDMSLVGPRPPLPGEVAHYAEDVHRRLLVRPGMTGLWQVNGRSNLTWEETVRFDLYYVENWSVMADLLILWRTGRAVLASDGAY